MNLKTILVAMFVCAAGALSMGCADPCGDLSDKCATCTDTNEQSACQIVATFGDDDSCEAALDAYPSCK